MIIQLGGYFVVRQGIAAAGTRLDVRLYGDAATITVVEGLVAVSGSDQRPKAVAPLIVGESLKLLWDGTTTLAQTVDVEPLRYWREGKIFLGISARMSLWLSSIANWIVNLLSARAT